MRIQMTVHFDREEWKNFMRPITGNGGGQVFIRTLQARADYRNKSIALTDNECARFFRYRDAYGGGGFQSRLGRTA